MSATERSKIGHGRLGAISAIRRLSTLAEQGRSQKQAFIELRASKLVGVGLWIDEGGGVFSSVNTEFFPGPNLNEPGQRGRYLDVVEVRSPHERLTRVEQLAGLAAGQYFYDPEGNGETLTSIYVRLTTGTPADLPIVVVHAFYFATHRTVQPTLGPNKFVDPGVEAWGSPTSPTSWQTSGATGVDGGSVNRDATYVASGTYSARLEGTVVPGGFLPFYQLAAFDTIVGARYRFAGVYRTDPDASPSSVAQVRIRSGASVDVDPIGRGTVALRTGYVTLKPTAGELRRFLFDFEASHSTSYPIMVLGASGATAYGKIWFDDLLFARIYRFEPHEPRLPLSALPSVSEGRSGILFDRWELGQGAVTVLNDDHPRGVYVDDPNDPTVLRRLTTALEDLIASYEFTNNDAYVYLGGRFPYGGSDVPKEDMVARRWLQRKPQVGDANAVISLDDPKQLLLEKLPNRAYSAAVFTNVAKADDGKVRQLLFGPITNVRPALVDKTGFGVYEIADGAMGVNGLDFSPLVVYSYLDSTAAEQQDALRRVTLDENDYTADGATGALTMLTNVTPVEITVENNRLDFDIGGAALVAVIPPGIYEPGGTLYGLTKAITDAMVAVGGAGLSAAYSTGTNKYSLAKTAGTLNIKIATGANKHIGIWKVIGFDAGSPSADKTGLLTYVGDVAVFSSPEKQIFRVDTNGFKDDAAGTYTGTPFALIETSCDIMYFLMRHILSEPVGSFDLSSLATVRPGADGLTVCLGVRGSETLELGAIVERLENSNGIELIWTGTGYRWQKRDNLTPANIITVYDRDIGPGFLGWYDEDNVFSVVVVPGDQNPATGHFPFTVFDESFTGFGFDEICLIAKARLGRNKQITIPTYCRGGAMIDFINELVVNSANNPPGAATVKPVPRRRFRVPVKGKALRVLAGDKIRLAKDDFLGRSLDYPAGDVVNGVPGTVCLRVIHTAQNQQTWDNILECVEVIFADYYW